MEMSKKFDEMIEITKLKTLRQTDEKTRNEEVSVSSNDHTV